MTDQLIPASYLDKLKARPKKGQPTFHQQDGQETAEAFGEPGKTSLYARLFKRYPFDRAKLIECREWVLKQKDVRKPGALFMSTYRKFLNPQPFKSQA